MRLSLYHNNRTLALCLLAMLAATESGCHTNSEPSAGTTSSAGKPMMPPAETAKRGKPVTIGVLLPPKDEPATRALEKAMQDAARTDNVTLTVQYITDSSAAPANQPIETLLKARPDAVILLSYGSLSIDSAVMAANQAHIPVFTVADRGYTGQAVEHIESDQQQGGRLAAQRLARLLEDKGGVLILAGDFAPKATKAFRDEMARHPGIQILAETPFRTKYDQTEADLRDSFTRFGGKTRGLFAVADTAGEQAMQQCVEQERKDVVIIGFSGSSGVQEDLKQGAGSLWRAEIVASTERLGQTAVEQAATYLRGQKVASTAEVEMEEVDVSNVDSWVPPIWTTSFN